MQASTSVARPSTGPRSCSSARPLITDTACSAPPTSTYSTSTWSPRAAMASASARSSAPPAPSPRRVWSRIAPLELGPPVAQRPLRVVDVPVRGADRRPQVLGHVRSSASRSASSVVMRRCHPRREPQHAASRLRPLEQLAGVVVGDGQPAAELDQGCAVPGGERPQLDAGEAGLVLVDDAQAQPHRTPGAVAGRRGPRPPAPGRGARWPARPPGGRPRHGARRAPPPPRSTWPAREEELAGQDPRRQRLARPPEAVEPAATSSSAAPDATAPRSAASISARTNSAERQPRVRGADGGTTRRCRRPPPGHRRQPSGREAAAGGEQGGVGDLGLVAEPAHAVEGPVGDRARLVEQLLRSRSSARSTRANDEQLRPAEVGEQGLGGGHVLQRGRRSARPAIGRSRGCAGSPRGEVALALGLGERRPLRRAAARRRRAAPAAPRAGRGS